MLNSILTSKTSYVPVQAEDSEEDEKRQILTSPERKSRTIALLLGLFLTASLGVNTKLLLERTYRPWQLYDQLPTRVAGLTRNVGTTITEKSDYSNRNQTIQDAAWNRHEVDSYSLYVALDDDYSSSLGLPHSQRWPWDESKGVYVLSAAHEIHCVKVIRSVLNDQHGGVPEDRRLWQYSHAVHCLDMIRMAIMCNADDDLLYTGQLHANVHVDHPIVGNGMTKWCRDWDALMEWADQHSACYALREPGNDDYPEIERYKFCPDGARPWEEMET